jgi:hypothetical protein
MSAKNGVSYQNGSGGGSGGSYTEVGADSSIHSGAAGSGSARKWIFGAGLAVVLGVVSFFTIKGHWQHSSPQETVQKAMAGSNTGIQVKANGKLKLFDDHGESDPVEIVSVECEGRTGGDG